MITIIFGEPGAGKTSLLAYFLKQIYRRQGDRLLNECRDRIAEENKTREKPLTLPNEPPIFCDFAVKFLVGYEKEYSPYFINGYYFGVENGKMPTQYVPPGSKIFLSEAQRYFDSRRSATFPDHVSRAFEMHRHFGLDIYLDAQREGLIDLNIRGLCKRFIEVRKAEHEKTATGRIVKTTFFCREFDDLISVEQYLSGGSNAYRETTYVNRGNIFRSFDSFNHQNDFIPGKGRDYRYLPFLAKGENVPENLKMFYETEEPKAYRGSGNKKEKKAE